MGEELTVYVVQYRDRENLVLRYRCPNTGKQITRSAGTGRRKEAEKMAAQWELQLREGRYQSNARIRWEEFRLLWEDTKLPTVKPATARSYVGTMNAFEACCRPNRVGDLNTTRVSTFARELRTRGLAPATIAGHLRSLKAIARWACKHELLPKVPEIEMPRHAGAKMKGRPITGEEFDRLLDAVPHVVGDSPAESWRHVLRGLWWSGLRLGEALALRWDQQAGGVWTLLDGRRSVLAFDAGSQKSGKVELVPLAPEAVELLEPVRRERGFVFAPHRLRGEGELARDKLKVGKILSAIGAKAGVVVDHETGKTATAHDLRRSFGFRWSRRVMPPDLKTLMRHASIETTLTYYVGQNAQATASALWDAVGNNPGNSGPCEQAPSPASGSEVTAMKGLAKRARQDSNLRPAD